MYHIDCLFNGMVNEYLAESRLGSAEHKTAHFEAAHVPAHVMLGGRPFHTIKSIVNDSNGCGRRQTPTEELCDHIKMKLPVCCSDRADVD